MSKYLMLLLATAALSLTACGKDSKKDENNDRGRGGRVLNKGAYPNVAQTIFGQWKMPDEMDNGVLFRQNLYWNQNSMGVEVVCERGREQATASFSVNVRINNNTVEILESAERTVKNGNMNCTASISPAKFNYAVQGSNFLRLFSDDNKGEMNLTRIF